MSNRIHFHQCARINLKCLWLSLNLFSPSHLLHCKNTKHDNHIACIYIDPSILIRNHIVFVQLWTANPFVSHTKLNHFSHRSCSFAQNWTKTKWSVCIKQPHKAEILFKKKPIGMIQSFVSGALCGAFRANFHVRSTLRGSRPSIAFYWS